MSSRLSRRYRVEHLSGKTWVRGIAGCTLGAAQRIAVCVALARRAPVRIVNAKGKVVAQIQTIGRSKYRVA